MSTSDQDESSRMPEVQKYRPRACQNCARSKMKCEWSSKPGVSPCHRCSKLKATCVLPQVNARRRRGPSIRVGQLENKLDGIISLLNAGQRNSSGPIASQRELPDTLSPGWLQPQQSLATSASPSSTATASPELLHTTSAENVEIVPGFTMTFDEADGALDLYRSAYAPYFPFVPLPVTMTAPELNEVAPLLLRTILQIVVPQTATVQRSVDRWFRHELAQHVVVEMERRVEHLQAILVFIAWGNFHFYIKSQATDLLQLADTIVLDLQLDKPPNSLGVTRQAFLPDTIRKVKGSRLDEHTLDDMRAMLGFSYLNSVVATLFQRTRSFMYAPYLMRCCDALLSAREYDSDEFLVALVRMQRLLTRLPNPDQDETIVDAPLRMIMSTTRKELDALVQNQSPEVQRNVLLWTHYYGVLIRLYEPAIHMRPSAESTGRTEALSACLQAAKDFFAAYANIPLDRLGSMPLGATAYMAFAVVTSCRILILNDSDWHVRLARQTFDFAAACQCLGNRFKQADRLAQSLGQRRKFKEDEVKSVLAAYSAKIMWIRQWYLAKVSARPEGGQGSGGDPTYIPSGGQVMDMDQLMPPQEPAVLPFELDEAFWSGLLGPNDWSM